ncbi:MAG: hypothetical protein P1U89_10605 [Verrucomicrobiales bacterium]|nr:hypothetical protein [Verrucomicrobiales bacterium]
MKRIRNDESNSSHSLLGRFANQPATPPLKIAARTPKQTAKGRRYTVALTSAASWKPFRILYFN